VLFIVATPIGNLEDLSFRALRTLREADLIAAEDTRRTAKLLTHYEIRRPMISLREHNEAREAPRLIARLQKGESIALVSDAGTPGISDPGARLVRAARESGVTVVPIPGPNAVATALSASGFPADQFVFAGFPPRSGEARREWFEALRDDPRTLVLFEAPHRIESTFEDLRHYLAERPMILARELTKINEEFVISPSQVAHVKNLGEFTVVIGPVEASSDAELDEKHVLNIFGRLTEEARFDEQTAMRLTGHLLDVPSRQIAKIIKKHKISVKRQIERLS
jgi:probable S-adenosylmethionine-dependent methyltransferase, YraL family